MLERRGGGDGPYAAVRSDVGAAPSRPPTWQTQAANERDDEKNESPIDQPPSDAPMDERNDEKKS